MNKVGIELNLISVASFSLFYRATFAEASRDIREVNLKVGQEISFFQEIFSTNCLHCGSKVHFLFNERSEDILSLNSLLVIPVARDCNFAQGFTTNDAGVSNFEE